MQELILQLDYWLLEQINQRWTSSVTDFIFYWLSDLNKIPGFKFIAPLIVLFFYIYRYKKQGILKFVILLLAVGFSDWTGGRIKHVFERARPSENLAIQVVSRTEAGGASFYSNHSSNMMTFAFYTAEFFPAAKIPLVALAGLVAYSRVYNGVHYPSDVVFGMLMGLAWGFLFLKLIRRFDAPRARKITE